MIRNRFWARLALGVAVGAAATFMQCGSDDDATPAGGCEGAVPANVIYPDEERASDEALARVWDARCHAAPDPAKASSLVEPAAGTTLPPDAPVVLRWNEAGGTLAVSPRQAHGRAPAGALENALGGFHFGVREAAAHEPPITGWVYLLELRPADGSEPLYVFTADGVWTPDEVAWARMKAMGAIDATIWSAYLEENVIYDPSTDGPFVSPAPVHFVIGTP